MPGLQDSALLQNVASKLEASSSVLSASTTDIVRPVPVPPLHPIGGSSLVFVDAGLADYQTLAANVQPGAEVYVLRAGDAIAQMTQVLLQHTNVSSVHIVSHGSSGELELGGRWIGLNDLNSRASQIKSWAGVLSAGADILLYGCDVAAGTAGTSFVQQLAQLTGADIAASTDPTGSAQLGGDWNFELKTGAIESPLVFSPEFIASYTGILIAPIVTLTASNSYTENTAPVLLDGQAIVFDGDLPISFNNGSITLGFTSGGIASDRLGIRNQGIAAGQIGLDGRTILYSGAPIGYFSGGFGDNLVINFNSLNATPIAVQALLRNLTYSNVGRDLPQTGSRTLSLVLTDGTGSASVPVSQAIVVTGVNDAPLINNTTILYNGSTNQLPDAAGSAAGAPWFAYRSTSSLGGTASVVATNGGTLLTSDAPVSAGYSNYRFNQNLGIPTTFTPVQLNPTTFPVLDRNAGYVLNFTAQLNSESRTLTADKNNDGRDDRAGFSVIVLSSDRKGIELGFWNNRVWAQEDGTTQQNPALEPDTPPINTSRTFFTQAEFNNTINTTQLTNYSLAVLGNTYTLFGNGAPLLTGQLRDYSAFVPPTVSVFGIPVQTPNPYVLPNFIFFGDNTPSAQAQVQVNSVAISTNAPLPSRTVTQNIPLTFPVGLIEDIDAGSSIETVTVSAANGIVTINPTVPGGLGIANIAGNSTAIATLTGTLAQINTTLGSATALTYRNNANFFGTDTLTITANDRVGGVTSKQVAISVLPTFPIV